MFLAEDKVRPANPAVPGGSEADLSILPGGKWRTFPNSMIGHHGASCCDIAHEWLTAFDFAQLNGGDVLSGPRWLREHSAWGPTVWPVHWCEVVDAKTVDCGVHAALAQAVFVARGVTAFRAQFVQRYSPDAAASWRQNWKDLGASEHWIDDDSIYHEGNAVLVGKDTVKLWDGSSGCWINPRGKQGYGSIEAVRIETEQPADERVFAWGSRLLPANRWTAV